MDSKKSQKRARLVRELAKQAITQVRVQQAPSNIPAGAHAIGRLQYVSSEFPFDESKVAEAIAFSPGGAIFCDSTVFIAPTAPAIWRAMTDRNRIMVIPKILGEIIQWYESDSAINIDARKRMKAALSGDMDSKIGFIEQPSDAWKADAIWYYADLLGVRKIMWHMAEGQLTNEFGRAPTPQEISNYIQKFGSSRAQLLAQQGRKPKVLENMYNDEWLVATALGYAVTSGIETTIVTSDEAVLDQYLKATLLLTRHYESMYLADLVVQSPQLFELEAVQNPNAEFFSGPEISVGKFPFKSRSDFLPQSYHGVQIHCMLLQKNVTRYTFRAEEEMTYTFKIKHETNGLSTDLFDGRNIYSIPPRSVRRKGAELIVVAKDMTVDMGGAIPLSWSDIEYSLANDDQFQSVKWVDPKVLLIPPHYQDGGG